MLIKPTEHKYRLQLADMLYMLRFKEKKEKKKVSYHTQENNVQNREEIAVNAGTCKHCKDKTKTRNIREWEEVLQVTPR